MSIEGLKRFELTDKVAIVTGSTKGIGFNIAIALAKCGAHLVLCGRKNLHKIDSEVENIGRKKLAQKMDVTCKSDIKEMVSNAVKYFGHIDILVSNAGINIPQKSEEVTEESWDKVLDTNLKGTCRSIE